MLENQWDGVPITILECAVPDNATIGATNVVLSGIPTKVTFHTHRVLLMSCR